ncbi:MAG: RDD family protein [Deltaproteobacteria bacterium]|nr:RDD family protein [Deltaproteobacteria bacterium]
MPLNWDDDDEEELTEIEFKKRSSRAVVHDETTTPFGEPLPVQRREPVKEVLYQPPPTPPQTPLILKEPRAPAVRPQPAGTFAPAPTRDRFAAFLVDSLIGFYVYFLVGFGLLKFFSMPTLVALHQGRGRFGMHVLGTLSVMFFYYVGMESVFGATLGKLFCRLRVIEENGQSASLGNVFIRNFLRVVDYPLFFLIAVIAMESSPLNQRLGDRAAKTIVIKKTRRYLPAVDLAHTPLASTLSRLFAEGLDLMLSLLLIYGVFLLARPGRPLLSYVILLSIPIVFIAYYTLLELLTGTTPGKALFKRQVVLDHGEPPDGTSALLRNLFRPFDYLLGYPLMTLSRRKQRLGDMAADTLVVAKAPHQKAWMGCFIAAAIVLVIAYFGFHNPDNLIRRQYGLGPIEGLKIFLPGPRPQVLNTPPTTPPGKAPGVKPAEAPKILTPLPATTSDKLNLVEFYFATGPAPGQIRKDGTFRSGDLVFVFFKVQGLQLNEQQEASIREDLQVEDPEGKILVSQPNVVELTKVVKEDNPSMLFANQIKLPREAPVGQYRAVFTVHDKVAETQFSFEKSFDLQ